MALVAAAVCKYPNQNVLIIDAGTCITYDFIDAKSNYCGGAISPGIQMRYKALYENTDRLPLLEPIIPSTFIGNSTQSAIHSGVVFGVVNEIEGVVASYKYKYSDLTVILSGGDANFLCKQFKISIFAFSNFLLEGLNFLLEYNSNK
jgi:type III pantothenate kinase